MIESRIYAPSLATSIKGLDRKEIYSSVYKFLTLNDYDLVLDKWHTSSPITMGRIIEMPDRNYLSFKTPQNSFYHITYSTSHFSNASNIVWLVCPENGQDSNLRISMSSQVDYLNLYGAIKIIVLTHLSFNGDDPVCSALKAHIENSAIEEGLDVSPITT